MIIRAATVVELPAGTVVNVAGTVDDLRLVDRALAQVASDEAYAALGTPVAGFLRGAYMDLLVDAQGRSDAGATVPLPRGTHIFALPGTVVAVVGKASVAQKSGCAGVGWAIGAGILGVIIGAVVGRATR